jgi:alpha-glucosidase
VVLDRVLSTSPTPPQRVPNADAGWARGGVVYEVYIRSFADADGDGIGDIAGIRSRLSYLHELGVDAVWITPWYPSPQVDGGYDVADYRGIDPAFGTLADAEALFEDAHALGLRVILDIVPNHTSSAHPWFVEALASPPGSAARGRYVFRDGRGASGEAPPTDWLSLFGGRAWTRVREGDGSPGQWYLHMFDPAQPDLEWQNPEVRAEFEDVLRTWFDRGADGLRIDVASALVKDHDRTGPQPPPDPGTHAYVSARDPLMNQAGVHEIYRAWRRIADAHSPPRVLLGEIHAPTPEGVVAYLGPDELDAAFNFQFLRCPWDADQLRSVIDDTLAAHAAVGAAPTWVLSNHDEIRHVTRYGRVSTGIGDRSSDELMPSDLELGTRRARAGALLMLALPGAVYLYQGEELGLPEVPDLPEAALRDPTWERSGHRIRGRDGCRVPIPWSGARSPYGFGPEGSVPWLPQPPTWGSRSVEAQSGDPTSMFELYRAALAARRSHPGLAGEAFRWLPTPEGVLMFERDEGLRCVVNLGASPFALARDARVVLTSEPAPVEGGVVPIDAAAWFTAPS